MNKVPSFLPQDDITSSLSQEDLLALAQGKISQDLIDLGVEAFKVSFIQEDTRKLVFQFVPVVADEVRTQSFLDGKSKEALQKQLEQESGEQEKKLAVSAVKKELEGIIGDLRKGSQPRMMLQRFRDGLSEAWISEDELEQLEKMNLEQRSIDRFISQLKRIFEKRSEIRVLLESLLGNEGVDVLIMKKARKTIPEFIQEHSFQVVQKKEISEERKLKVPEEKMANVRIYVQALNDSNLDVLRNIKDLGISYPIIFQALIERREYEDFQKIYNFFFARALKDTLESAQLLVSPNSKNIQNILRPTADRFSIFISISFSHLFSLSFEKDWGEICKVLQLVQKLYNDSNKLIERSFRIENGERFQMESSLMRAVDCLCDFIRLEKQPSVDEYKAIVAEMNREHENTLTAIKKYSAREHWNIIASEKKAIIWVQFVLRYLQNPSGEIFPEIHKGESLCLPVIIGEIPSID